MQSHNFTALTNGRTLDYKAMKIHRFLEDFTLISIPVKAITQIRAPHLGISIMHFIDHY